MAITNTGNLPDGSAASQQEKLLAEAFPAALPDPIDRNKFLYELYIKEPFVLCQMLCQYSGVLLLPSYFIVSKCESLLRT